MSDKNTFRTGDVVRLTDDAKKHRNVTYCGDVRTAAGEVVVLDGEWVRVRWNFLRPGQTWHEHITSLNRNLVVRKPRRVLADRRELVPA